MVFQALHLWPRAAVLRVCFMPQRRQVLSSVPSVVQPGSTAVFQLPQSWPRAGRVWVSLWDLSLRHSRDCSPGWVQVGSLVMSQLLHMCPVAGMVYTTVFLQPWHSQVMDPGWVQVAGVRAIS